MNINMNNNPEEQFNNEVLAVLNLIKKESLYKAKHKAIQISVSYYLGPMNGIEPDNKFAIMKKLGEWGVFEVQNMVRVNRGTMFESNDFTLKIDYLKFHEIYDNFQRKVLKETTGIKVQFDDNEAAIKLGSKKCLLPAYKNEHYFCRAIFEYPVNEPVDWSLISEKMDILSTSTKGEKRDQRSLYDTMRAINERVEEILGIKNLFIWKNKSIRRTK